MNPLDTDKFSQISYYRTLPTKERPVREQMNLQTSFHDLSIVYGFNESTIDIIRANDGIGKFKVENNLLPVINDLAFITGLENTIPIAAGDPRANVNPWLLTLQMVFEWEDNHVAGLISSSGVAVENVFEEAHRIVIAEYQNIIYSEFLPVILGKENMKHWG